MTYISDDTKKRRATWLDKISVDGKAFGDVSAAFEKELNVETQKDGNGAILDHLRVCGHIPEKYAHDSSEKNYILSIQTVLYRMPLHRLAWRVEF